MACEVARQNGLALRVHTDSSGWRYYDDSHAVLPQIVRDWFGFSKNDPDLTPSPDVTYTASGLNDNLDYNFAQIADAFERTYLTGANNDS